MAIKKSIIIICAIIVITIAIDILCIGLIPFGLDVLGAYLNPEYSDLHGSTIDCKSNKKCMELTANCEARGGIYENYGPSGWMCNMPTKDAGKECKDRKECESLCIYGKSGAYTSDAVGTCYEWAFQRGCMNPIENGVALGFKQCR